MRARTMILLMACTVALAACRNSAQDQNIAIDNAVSNADLANADIEALPPDESSETPTNQLVTGDDQPDVNDLGNDSNVQ